MVEVQADTRRSADASTLSRTLIIRWTVAIFLIALAVRLALLFGLQHYSVIPPREMERVGESFAKTGTLANPYAAPTGPTAHVGPVYPVLLGLIYRCFGTGQEGHLAQGVFSCLLCALRCGLMLPLGLFLGLGYRASLFGALLSIFYIGAFNTEIRGGWEAPLAALFVMGMVYLAARYRRRGFGLGEGVTAGIFVGIGALVSPAVLSILVAFLCAAWFFSRADTGRFWRWALPLIAALILTLLPWALRNQREMGKMVWLRSNFGLELWVSYNDHTAPTVLSPHLIDNDPGVNPVVARQVRQMGELQFHKMKEREAIAWIKAHPERSLRLFLWHTFYFWFPDSTNRYQQIILGLFTVIAFGGLIVMWRRYRFAALIVALIWLAFPPMYYLMHWSSRYRYPIDWTFVLCAGVFLSYCWRKMQVRQSWTAPA